MDNWITTALIGIAITIAGCSSHVAGGVDIWKAVERDDAGAIAIYAASGGDLDALNRDGSTPLWVALDRGHRSSYESLLKYGADPNVIMSGKRVVTHWAASSDDPWWLTLALEHGADPNLVNVGRGRPSEGTPLHFAIGNGITGEADVALENVKTLVMHNADVNKPDRYNCFPLSDAAAQNRFTIVLYLLEHGADYKNSQCAGLKFLDVIRTKCRYKDRVFRLQEDRDGLDAVREWLEDHGVEFSVDEE